MILHFETYFHRSYVNYCLLLIHDVSKVNANQIIKIELGQKTEAFQQSKILNLNQKDFLSISIIFSKSKLHSDQIETLNLIMNDEDDVEFIKNVLTALITKVKSDKENSSPDKLYLNDMWNRADSDGDGKLEENEIYALLASLNININRNTCRKMFKEFDVDKSNYLDFQEFSNFVEKLRER